MTDATFVDINKESVTKAYDKWAPVYDLVFGAVFDRGRQAAIQAKRAARRPKRRAA